MFVEDPRALPGRPEPPPQNGVGLVIDIGREWLATQIAVSFSEGPPDGLEHLIVVDDLDAGRATRGSAGAPVGLVEATSLYDPHRLGGELPMWDEICHLLDTYDAKQAGVTVDKRWSAKRFPDPAGRWPTGERAQLLARVLAGNCRRLLEVTRPQRLLTSNELPHGRLLAALAQRAGIDTRILTDAGIAQRFGLARSCDGELVAPIVEAAPEELGDPVKVAERVLNETRVGRVSEHHEAQDAYREFERRRERHLLKELFARQPTLQMQTAVPGDGQSTASSGGTAMDVYEDVERFLADDPQDYLVVALPRRAVDAHLFPHRRRADVWRVVDDVLELSLEEMVPVVVFGEGADELVLRDGRLDGCLAAIASTTALDRLQLLAGARQVVAFDRHTMLEGLALAKRVAAVEVSGGVRCGLRTDVRSSQDVATWLTAPLDQTALISAHDELMAQTAQGVADSVDLGWWAVRPRHKRTYDPGLPDFRHLLGILAAAGWSPTRCSSVGASAAGTDATVRLGPPS